MKNSEEKYTLSDIKRMLEIVITMIEKMEDQPERRVSNTGIVNRNRKDYAAWQTAGCPRDEQRKDDYLGVSRPEKTDQG